MGNKDIIQLIQQGMFDNILNSFHSATDLKTVIVDMKGNVLRGREGHFCEFCKEIRKTKTGCELCRDSYCRAGNDAAKYGGSYIFRCHAGLISIAIPVMMNGESICTIFVVKS